MDNPLGAILIAAGGLALGAVTGFVGGMMYTTRKLAGPEIEQLKDLASGKAASPDLQADITAKIHKLAEENDMDPNSLEGMTYGARKLLEEGGMSLFDFEGATDTDESSA